MPYINADRKEQIEIPHITSAGELTYVIDRMAEELAWQMSGYDFDKLRYETLATVRGAITNAGDELYRRVIAAYEDRKLAENGDVFVYPHPEQWRIEETLDATVVDVGVLTFSDEPRVGKFRALEVVDVEEAS